MTKSPGRLESSFDAAFASSLAIKEKQVQQSYRPIIGVHKWFARRPGTMFRALMLAEFGEGPLTETFWKAGQQRGVIADPFMGGGTPLYEANRLGFNVVGCDINPMAHWVVSESLSSIDTKQLATEAQQVINDTSKTIDALFQTTCTRCNAPSPVKYFIHVKQDICPSCDSPTDLFPGFRLAEPVRHPAHVLACRKCKALTDITDLEGAECSQCGEALSVEGNVKRGKATCLNCSHEFKLAAKRTSPCAHRLWAIEYHCPTCYSATPGRMFKAPDSLDLALQEQSKQQLLAAGDDLPCPDEVIPEGDETNRLIRWGYRKYRELFSSRQLLALGTLLNRINKTEEDRIRSALLTVFSDFIRYQNLLCRYDTYALKCQDIFSVHGFPVGLVQCENNVLGISGVGTGGYRHFIEKYLRAKQYCETPFETMSFKGKKRTVYISGESLTADLVSSFPTPNRSVKQAWLLNIPSQLVELPLESLDGVFTDPPYYDNVQYAELMDFCYVWLRLGHNTKLRAGTTTRSASELTGNSTMKRGLLEFTDGMSQVFTAYAAALRPGAPFVFTYHHNDPKAYIPLVVAILDAGLCCTATLPAAAEMGASLHISGTSSSVLDSVFVCRRLPPASFPTSDSLAAALTSDAACMASAGIRTSVGDLKCLTAGHLARFSIVNLFNGWDPKLPLDARIARAEAMLDRLSADLSTPSLIAEVISAAPSIRSAAVSPVQESFL